MTEPPKTVLIVDDDEAIREITQEILEDEGFVVRLASTGEEALTVFAQTPLDFAGVLLDYSLPMANGNRVLLELRKISADIPVVMMTGYTQTDLADLVTAQLAGCIEKPFRVDTLVTIAHDAFGNSNG